MRAQTVSSPEEKNWEAICAQAKARPFTPPRLTKPLSENELRKCDSRELYYGFDGKADPAAALQCAYDERARDRSSSGPEDPFAGPGVLAMLYANGMAVERDYNLAIRFVCESPLAKEVEVAHSVENERKSEGKPYLGSLFTSSLAREVADRIGRLEHLRDTGAKSEFDLCDDAMNSDHMIAACESVHENLEELRRRPQLEAIARGCSPSAKTAFRSLQKAEAEFEDARTNNEFDFSGTIGEVYAVADLTRLRDQFLTNLKRFAKGDILAASETDQQATDRKLNDVYRRLVGIPQSQWQSRPVPPLAIRKTERVWIKLRDAWIEFGRLAYPELSSTRLATEITRLRIEQLQHLAHGSPYSQPAP